MNIEELKLNKDSFYYLRQMKKELFDLLMMSFVEVCWIYS